MLTRSHEHLLIQRMASGDVSALGELYDLYARAVCSLAYRILRDSGEAEDVVQDVFSQAWRQAGQYDAARAHAGAWLMMMCRSRALDRVRSRGARLQTVPDPAACLEAADGMAADPESNAITAQDASRVRAALASLQETERTAIELAYYEGLSQTEIAERLSEPLGTIKTRIRTGLLKLRSALRGG
jgi:RNA polymerase sigma-70 factor (ECF subfamily)